MDSSAALAHQRRRTYAIPVALTTVGVGLQVLNPLLSGDALLAATIGAVLALALAAFSHAWVVRGPRWALQMSATVIGLSMAVEATGVATGVPFGSYTYTDALGPMVLGVPLLVPMAWLMLCYPVFLASYALLGRRLAWLAGAWTMTAWDVFLDPQMVEAGYWVWDHEGATLPGVPGIPAVNYLGWFVTAAAIMAVLSWLTPAQHPLPGQLPHDALPAVVLVWTYASQVMGNLVFWDRWSVALLGAAAMGLTVIPYVLPLWRGTQARAEPAHAQRHR